MKDRTTNLDTLRRYCLENNIPFPATATREELEAFITRAVLHERTLKPDAEIGCFGFWADEDTNCLVCLYAEECAKASLGMDAKRYKRFVRSLDNPRFSLQLKARRDKASARKNHRVARRPSRERDGGPGK